MAAKFLALSLVVWLAAYPVAAEPTTATGVVPPPPKAAAVEPNTDARQQARERFEAGMKLYEEGEYALALLEFERAHGLVPGFRVLYNIGQVNIQLGRYARAARKLRQYLAEGADQVSDERRTSVLSDLDMLTSRTASVLVLVNVSGAEVVLDNDVIAMSPMPEPLLVDAGEHRLTIRKHGYLDQTRPVALAGRDHVQLELVLTEAPKSVAVEKTVIVERPEPIDANEPSARRHVTLTLGWTGTGLLATAWAVTGYMGLRTSNERHDKLTEVTSAAELAELKQRTRNWYIAADICGGLTIAAATTMVYYTFFAPRPTPGSNVLVGFSPGSVLLTGQF